MATCPGRMESYDVEEDNTAKKMSLPERRPCNFLESSPSPPTAPSGLGDFASVFPVNDSGTDMGGHEVTSFSLDRFMSGLPESGPRSPQDTKLRKTISDVVSRQADVFAKRSQARELRLALRYKRDEEAAIRAELLKKINAFHAQRAVENMQSLSSEVEKIQSATDAYLSLENRYHRVEDQLEQDEYALSKMERKLSGLLCRLLPTNGQRNHSDSEDGDSEDATSTISDDVHFNPLHSEYLSRVGDVDILRERLSDLDCERFAIAEKGKLRMRLNIPLDAESQELLSTYEERKTRIQEELNDALRDVYRLKEICQDQDILKNTSDNGKNIKGCDIDFENTTPHNEPLMVSEFEDASPFFEQDMSRSLNRTNFFINKWILHKLRHSSIETLYLKTTAEVQNLLDMGWDETDISRLSLQVWYADDTAAFSPPPTISDGTE
ncbi:hypothetical protein VTN02DRAFT_1565 [Thermoascus thermophilus]